MTTIRIEAPPKSSVEAVIFLVVSLFLLGAGALAVDEASRGTMLCAAVLPFLVAVACWMTRPRHFRAELTDLALVVHDPTPLELPFGSVQAVAPEGGPDGWFPIHVIHDHGVVTIPAHVDPLPAELLGELCTRLPDLHARLPSDLLQIYQRHVATFGSERVFAFPGRSRPFKRVSGRRGIALAWAFISTGVLWIIVSLVTAGGKEPAFGFGFGALVAFLGLLMLLVSMSRRDAQGGRILGRSGLVISPVGLALIQGDLRGEMSWSELVNLRYIPRPRIDLIMSGARVSLNDRYSHPLFYIHDVMKRYWK